MVLEQISPPNQSPWQERLVEPRILEMEMKTNCSRECSNSESGCSEPAADLALEREGQAADLAAAERDQLRSVVWGADSTYINRMVFCTCRMTTRDWMRSLIH